MKHLKLYTTEESFADEMKQIVKPWVSLTADDKKVHYSISKKGLRFTALSDMTITMSHTGEFANTTFSCTDSKGELLTDDLENNPQSVNAGERVYVYRNDGEFEEQEGDDKRFQFVTTGTFNLGGNIDEFLNNNGVLPPYACYDLFTGCDGVIDASQLKLPAMELTPFCYGDMFENCINLEVAPKLPATTLAEACYSTMFYKTALRTAPQLPAQKLANLCYTAMFIGCNNLVKTPQLPATEIAQYCYQYMFRDCISLKQVTKLPATDSAKCCYYAMFQGCTALETAPELPAEVLATGCYQFMFRNCSKLNYIKAMFTTTPSTSYTRDWVSGVASNGTFVKSADATWDVNGVNGIPNNWTVKTC